MGERDREVTGAGTARGIRRGRTRNLIARYPAQVVFLLTNEDRDNVDAVARVLRIPRAEVGRRLVTIALPILEATELNGREDELRKMRERVTQERKRFEARARRANREETG